MDRLLNIIVRHQVYLERLKAGRSLELSKTIGKLDAALRTQLAFVDYDSLSDMSRTALNKLIVELRRVARTVFDVWLNELIRWLGEYVREDALLWKKAFGIVKPEAIPTLEEETPDDEKLLALALAFPMAANGIMSLMFAKSYTILAVDKIGIAANRAYANAETPRDLVKAIVGTKEARNNDGLLAQLNRQGNAVTNTIVQHVANQIAANMASRVWKRYLWCSVIDDATTNICRSRNGKVFEYGKGPVPPAHVGCRSSIVPFDGDPFDIPSFPMWAGSQSKEFIADAFDGEVPSRYEQGRAISLATYRAKQSLILS